MNALKSSGENGPLGVENGLLDVGVQAQATGLEGRFDHAVPGMEITTVQAERLDDAVAGRRVPGVGQEHAADVEEEGRNLGHRQSSIKKRVNIRQESPPN